MSLRSDDLAWLSLEEASRLIRQREVSPVALTEAAITRIDSLDDALHAFITVDREGARAAARLAEHEIAGGRWRGHLHGIPLSIKDCLFTRDLPTTAGSQIYEGWIPDSDAGVVEKLRAAGAVVLGKANMYELATGWGTTGYFPLAVNPWSRDHTPGGSSSGSAVAVAAGMGYVSIGTDGGGSVRVPANYSGVTGLKPTYGLVSAFGSIPVGPSVSHVGILARHVRDAAMVLGSVVGYDDRDPGAVRGPEVDYANAPLPGLSGLTLGVPWSYIEGHLLPSGRAVFDASLDVLRHAGARLVDFDVPMPDRVAPTWTTIVYAELAAFHEQRLQEHPGDFGVELRQRIEMGLSTRAVDYYRAQEERAGLRAEYVRRLQAVDLVVSPTAPGPAPTMEELTKRRGDLQDLGQLARYTRPFNLTGFPAITVPGGYDEKAMPLGLQFAGKPFDDLLVCGAAHAYQQLTDWHLRRPPLAPDGSLKPVLGASDPG